MPNADESAGAGNPLNAALTVGLDNISYSETITFTKYVRLVLPLDGFVFWVKADQIGESALANAGRLNSIGINAGAAIITPAATMTVAGSFHIATDQVQREDETLAVNTVFFNTVSEIQDFNEIGPSCIWIGEFEGVRFAFTRRRMFFDPANVFHYQGDAVYAALESQLIDDKQVFDTLNVVVSNSLPMWLKLDKFMPMYPSYLVPDNIEPPYAAVDIPAESTHAIQQVPTITRDSSHYQLVRERVRITIYGLRNFNALDFQDYVFAHSLFTDDFGVIGEMPVMRDAKRTQSELNVIAMKKIFDIDISYYQTRMRDIARQLITAATPSYHIA